MNINKKVFASAVFLSASAAFYYFFSIENIDIASEEVIENKVALTLNEKEVLENTKKVNSEINEEVIKDGSINHVISMREQWQQYPPHSRPLDEGAIDQIHYDSVEAPYSVAKGVDSAGQVYGSSYRCRLQPEKHTLTPEDAKQEITFFCLDAADQSIQMEISDLSAVIENPNGLNVIEQSYFDIESSEISHPSGLSSTGYRISFRNELENWGDVRLKLNYYHQDNPEILYTIQNTFSISPVVAGSFTGNFSEEIRDGSLFVYAEVDIAESGWYEFRANLKNNDAYIAVASHEGEFDEGLHKIPFEYFGKIFHDKSAEGPYTVTGARGKMIYDPMKESMFLPPEEFEKAMENVTYDRPTTQPIAPANDYITREYTLDDFSNAQYASQENDEHMRMLRGLTE